MALDIDVLPVSKIKPLRFKMSYEAFLEWADEDTHAEWVDGEVIVSMPARKMHQAIIRLLLQLPGLFVDLFDLGQVYAAPFEMKAQPEGSSRKPDILSVR